MYNIGLNKVITMVRGDTFIYEYKVNLGTNINPIYYTLKEGDYLYFGIMEPNQLFEEATVKKRYSSSDTIENIIEIKLDSDDTQNLSSGKYYYTIKLVKNNEDESKEVITLQPNTLFFIV